MIYFDSPRRAASAAVSLLGRALSLGETGSDSVRGRSAKISRNNMHFVTKVAKRVCYLPAVVLVQMSFLKLTTLKREKTERKMRNTFTWSSLNDWKSPLKVVFGR